jgi:hypothetical protein
MRDRYIQEENGLLCTLQANAHTIEEEEDFGGGEKERE